MPRSALIGRMRLLRTIRRGQSSGRKAHACIRFELHMAVGVNKVSP
jgi:hypothetical protein